MPSRFAKPDVGLLATIAVTVVLVAALAVGAVLAPRVLDARSAEERRAAVLQQARQIAVNFTTLDHRTFDEDVALVLDGATGTFRDEFRAGVEQTRSLVTENQSVSTGQVTEAAVMSADDDSARVLLVVDTEVTNSASPTPLPRHYRVQMDLSRTGDRWLASDLRFVG
jgi:Mce-associated membrane protein